MEMHQVETCHDGKTIIQPRKKGKVVKKRKYKRKKKEKQSMNCHRIKERKEKENKIQTVPL